MPPPGTRSSRGGHCLGALQNQSSDLRHRTQDQGNRDEPELLKESKFALRKLVEVCGRIDVLAEKRFKIEADENRSLLSRSSDKEVIGRELHDLNEGFSTLVKAATKRQESFRNMLEMARRLEESNSAEEISALIGVTMLPDYKSHINGLNEIAKIYERKIHPSIPILTKLTAFANQLDKIREWMHDMLNYDPTAKEDDIARMVSAIKNQDIVQFNAIFGKLDTRLMAEETPQLAMK